MVWGRMTCCTTSVDESLSCTIASILPFFLFPIGDAYRRSLTTRASAKMYACDLNTTMVTYPIELPVRDASRLIPYAYTCAYIHLSQAHTARVAETDKPSTQKSPSDSACNHCTVPTRVVAIKRSSEFKSSRLRSLPLLVDECSRGDLADLE